jgi:hypothetical protein
MILNIKEIFKKTALGILKSKSKGRDAWAAFSITEGIAAGIGAGAEVLASGDAFTVAKVALCAVAVCVPYAYLVAKDAENIKRSLLSRMGVEASEYHNGK